MGDEAIRAAWLRRVQAEPADFLRARFAYQLQQVNPSQPDGTVMLGGPVRLFSDVLFARPMAHPHVAGPEVAGAQVLRLNAGHRHLRPHRRCGV